MLHIEQWLKSGWNLFKDSWIDYVFLYSIYFLVGLLVQKIPLLPLIIMPGLFGSIVIITLQKIRGGRIDAKNLLLGYNYLLTLILASVMVSVLILAGFVLLIVPGIIAFAFYMFTIPLVVDRNLDFWQAMETSRKKVMENLGGFVVFALLIAALMILGAMTLGVGLLITMPLAINMLLLAYEENFPKNESVLEG